MYEVYCSHRNRVTARCDPSVGLLAVELKCTPGHASDLKRELIRKGWIRRTGRRSVTLLVGEFPAAKVSEIGASNHGIFRDSTTENSVVRPANHGIFRDSITEYSGVHIKDEPVVIEPVVAAASSAAARPSDSDPLQEPVDEDFVADVLASGVYPAGHVHFVLGKLRLRCKVEKVAPVKGRLLSWLSTERHTPQPTLPGVGGEVGEMSPRVAPQQQKKHCDHTCAACFGSGIEVVPGKGARRCTAMEEEQGAEDTKPERAAGEVT